MESIDPEGPFGAKECSEGSLAATIPAIANAIYDAVGVRLHESPFTPERVLAALRAKKKAKNLNLTDGIDPTAPTRSASMGDRSASKARGPNVIRLIPHDRLHRLPEAQIESAAIQIASGSGDGRCA